MQIWQVSLAGRNRTLIGTAFGLLAGSACGGLAATDDASVAANGGATMTVSPPSGGSPAGVNSTGGVAGAPPLCGVTGAGSVIADNVLCSASDPQQCVKPCGPLSLGTRRLTCLEGAYVEDPVCQFDPTLDYSCFRIPAVLSPECPQDMEPRRSWSCDVPPCIPCNLNGYFRDGARGLDIPGYCVCNLTGTDVPYRKWSCGQIGISWPCPGNPGC